MKYSKQRPQKTRPLNFSWLIDGVLAGHAAPVTEADLLFLKGQGIEGLVRMTGIQEILNFHCKIYKDCFSDFYEPVPDMTAPKQIQIDKIISFIKRLQLEGRPVGVSCGSGFGRTGTILACYLVSLGWEAHVAMQEVRLKRPGSIETWEQEDAVCTYGERLQTQ